MSWQRSQARQTGANEAPLAAPRRWGNADNSQSAPPPPQGSGYGAQNGGYGSAGGYGSNDRGSGGSSGWNDGRPNLNQSSHGNNQFNSAGGWNDGRGPAAPPPPPPSRFNQNDSGNSGGWNNSAGGNNAPPPVPAAAADSSAVPGERKRKSRWGADKVEGAAALPTAIQGNVEGKELENYAAQLRLDEINRAIRTGNVVPPDGARSPSPPPTYDGQGRRTNTREVRYRRKLEDERIRLVERQIKNNPDFKPPPEYLMAKRQSSGKPTDKVYIPVKEFPEINFFGLLVGPRGNSLKNMENASGAKISIRGKGSVKEGKGRPGGQSAHQEDENDELHCLITAETEEKVQRCVKLINSVIETAASVPEGQNDHKRNQLRELAQLNGTLRDDEGQICQNCGGVGHRKYDCPEQKNFSAGIICRICGGAGHMARDCTQRRPGAFSGPGGVGGSPAGNGSGMDSAKAQQFDSEYANLMAELGESSAAGPTANAAPSATAGGAPGSGTPNQSGNAPSVPAGQVGPDGFVRDENGAKIPPWRLPQNWDPPRPPRGPPMHHNQGGYQQGGYNQQYPQQGGQYGGYQGQQSAGGYQPQYAQAQQGY